MSLAERFYPEKITAEYISMSEYLHLVTFEGGGFLLMAADDRFPAVLAYSDDEAADRLHPAFIDHCSVYGREMEKILPQLRDRHASWDLYMKPGFSKPAVRSEVQPLITSTWNQSPYYNDQFPRFAGTETKAYAGCVAVVMGQLMRYYEHPPRGIGRRSYYDAGTDSLLTAWFDTTAFHWDNMPNSLNASSAADKIKEVSGLLYRSAVSVEMEFRTDGSYASYDDMLYAMVSYFDYHPGMFHANRSDHTATWSNMLKEELDSGFPVPYRGQGDMGGHAYLCDGYQITDTKTYYHINWGWGGNYDGWFLLSALTPAEGYDFSEMQGAVFGIRPNTDPAIYFAYNDFERTAFKGWIYGGDGYYTASYTGDYGYGISASNSWLISPKIHIPDNDNAELAVWAKMSAANRSGKVLLSLTDTLRGSFTVELGTIEPNNTNWNRYVYNLRSFKNLPVHIGFKYNSSAGYMILDDLRMSIPRPATDISPVLPADHAVLQVYPNPFNPLVNIRYTLNGIPAQGTAQVHIYNMRGDRVTTLTPPLRGTGSVSLVWDASAHPSGIYICVLDITGRSPLTQKMVLLK